MPRGCTHPTHPGTQPLGEVETAFFERPLHWRGFAPSRNLSVTSSGDRNPTFRSVGISYVQGTVRGPAGAEAAVRFLIDSGATYSLLPEPVWRAIGLAPKREMEFSLADGTTVRRPVSECHLSLPQGEGHTPVVLGQPGDPEPLLGVVTLENLGLVFDPFRRTLQPMRTLLV